MASNPGLGLIFNAAASSTPQVTLAILPGEYVAGSFQVQTDGTAAVSVSVQASNVPGQGDAFGPAYYRNDAAASTDYATLSTVTTATGTGNQNTMVSLPTEPYRSVRLLITASSGAPVTRVFYRSVGYNS
ncbi:MAG: hypothetical protein ACRYGG_05070 [Janthinobacterium lividum]